MRPHMTNHYNTTKDDVNEKNTMTLDRMYLLALYYLERVCALCENEYIDLYGPDVARIELEKYRKESKDLIEFKNKNFKE
jgi:hypothetical protein